MANKTQLFFDDDRSAALLAVESVAGGRGWVNVIVRVDDEVPDLRVNATGLWVTKGAPVASLVTQAPKNGVVRPSSLGLLHPRGRLSKEMLASITAGLPCVVRQNHSQRGLLLDVASDVPSTQLLDAMCTMTQSLCDFEMVGGWRLDLFSR